MARDQDRRDITRQVIAAVMAAAIIGAGTLVWNKLSGEDGPVAMPPPSGSSAPLTPTSSSPLPSEVPTTTSLPVRSEAVPAPPLAQQLAEAASPAPTSNRLTVVRIEPGRGGRTGVDEYREGATPGFGIAVYTEAGKVQYADECFVSWVYHANGEIISTSKSKCASGGITPFSSGGLVAGTGLVTADVTTGWGESGSNEYRFTVTR